MLSKLRNIKLLILDVDGVLTDGKILYCDDGTQTKAFFVPDGLGMKMLLRAGIEIAVISGKKSRATQLRLKELGVKYIFLGHENKTAIFSKLKSKLKIDSQQIAYIGDDIPDLPLMQQVGVSFAVNNAHPLLLKKAYAVTTKEGGCGAVREVCELILKAHKKFDQQLEFYY